MPLPAARTHATWAPLAPDATSQPPPLALGQREPAIHTLTGSEAPWSGHARNSGPQSPGWVGPYLLLAVKLGARGTVLSLLRGPSAVSTVLGLRALGGKVKALGWSSCQCTQMTPQPVTPPHTPLPGAPPHSHGLAHKWGDGKVGGPYQSSGCDDVAGTGVALPTGPSVRGGRAKEEPGVTPSATHSTPSHQHVPRGSLLAAGSAQTGRPPSPAWAALEERQEVGGLCWPVPEGTASGDSH